MKKVFISLTIAFLFIACSDNKDDKKAANEIKAEQKKEDGSVTIPKITVTENSTNIEKENPFISYDLDGNRVVRVSPDGSETPLTKELGALISIKNNYEKLNAKILAQRLSKNYIQKCSACHDNYANGVIGPSLLNKNENEIFQAIKVYQTGEKKNILMKHLISQMPDEEIRSLASEIAELNKEVRDYFLVNSSNNVLIVGIVPPCKESSSRLGVKLKELGGAIKTKRARKRSDVV